MKYVGMTIVLISVLLISRKYSAQRTRRLEECEAFLSFISYVREKLSKYTFTMREIGEEFESDALIECGFLHALRSVDAKTAYLSVREELKISDVADGVLCEFFENFGGGYLDDEMRRIADAEEKLKAIVEDERENAHKDIRIFGALFCAGGIGAVIILI